MKSVSTSKNLIANSKYFLSLSHYSFLNLLTRKPLHFYGWGRKKSGLKALELSKKYKSKYTLLEDGFIRSIGLGIKGAPSFSLVEDNIGIYYDATAPSRIENILNTYDFSVDEELMQTAQEAMALIKKHHISKYNHAADSVDDVFIEDEKEKVLVIAQTAGDASLEYGLGNRFSTQEMIADALEQN